MVMTIIRDIYASHPHLRFSIMGKVRNMMQLINNSGMDHVPTRMAPLLLDLYETYPIENPLSHVIL